jgi:hypothetical protein
LLPLFVLPLSCSDDDDSQEIVTPTNFYAAHNGVWVTSFSDGSQNLLDIYNNGWDSYSRTSNSGCWSSPSSVGGSTTIADNTPDELTAVTSNILASNVFSGDELQILTDAGYTYISISQAYLHTSSTLISFAQIFYAGDFEVELLTISGNFVKQSSDSFSTCKSKAENTVRIITEEAKIELQNRINKIYTFQKTNK